MVHVPYNASNKTVISTIVEVSVIVAGIISVIGYINSRSHKKLSKEIAEIDKELKTLQLNEKKNALNL